MIHKFAVMFFVYSVFLGGIGSFFTFIYLLFTNYYWLPLVYVAWLIYDRNTENEGGRNRTIKAFRGNYLWQKFSEYFPCRLIKTHELEPTRNYLMCAHPHGIAAHGLGCNVATDCTGFQNIFPGLTPHLMTLPIFFKFAIMRELCLAHGLCSSSTKSLRFILNNQGVCKQKGQVCILVVGGVAEMRETHPERIRIVLKNRKGFIKVALTTGVDIVPVFTFGENEIYGLKMSELARKGDLWFKLDRVTLPQMKTKAFWCQFFKEFVTNLIYAIHLFTTLPKQRPLTTVVGKPIPVCKVKEPTQKQIDELHELYINELKALFDQHKEKYLDNKEINLEII